MYSVIFWEMHRPAEVDGFLSILNSRLLIQRRNSSWKIITLLLSQNSLLTPVSVCSEDKPLVSFVFLFFYHRLDLKLSWPSILDALEIVYIVCLTKKEKQLRLCHS